MNMITATSPIDAAAATEMAMLRYDVRKVLTEANMTQADAARESGIANATFSAWLNDTYKGNSERIAQDVKKWLDARASARRTLARITPAPGFQATPTAQEFLDAIQYAHVAADISVIVGAPGIGKTMAARHYQSITPHVWLVTMEPTTAKPNAMLAEICAVMEVTEKASTRLSRAIGRHVRGKNGLLIIDEGQHLKSEAMDQLRTLNDLYGLGIVIIGNEAVVARLEGDKATFSQLYSRVGVRLRQTKAKPADIAAMISAWGVTDEEEARNLTVIARKPGALRSLDKTLKLASTLAAGAAEPRTLTHIRAAWSRLAPDTMAS